jgi:zinc protease
MSVLLLLPLVHHAQYDEQGNLIVLTDVSTNPLVYKLPNGLTVVLYADKSQPQVTGMVVTLAGGKNDLPDATGMAHYMEHMLFKGTTKIGTTNWSEESKHIQRIFELYDSLALVKDPEQKKQIQMRINEESLLANKYAIPNELDRILKEMGSTGINAGTGPDYTVYYNIFPPHQMERWLEVYSHRFSTPVFRSFQSELEVVYEEKNMYSDMFFMNLFEAFNQSFYKVHPYGQQPLIGTMEHLKNPSLTKMKEFYDRWYVANNMGLIITGDFNIEEVMPLIQEKFGNLQTGKIPEKISWVENPFNGREFVQKKLSPVKIGLLGYRIPANGHPDKLVMEVMASILTNGNGTGLLDKLSLDNQLLQAAAQNVHYADYGTGLIIFVPKIVGQSLDEAEQLVLGQIKKLRNGEFSDTLLEAIKLNMYRDKVMALENSTNMAYAFLDAFTSGSDFGEVWNLPQRVREISRDEVIRVAKEYYGENFLAFHSTMGFPKKEKIEKPGYAPVTKQQDESSQYYHMISEMPEKTPEYRFVDFDRDIFQLETGNGVRIYSVENLQNDVFSLTIKYGIGEGNMPILQYASQMMNLSGTDDLTQDEFRLRMAMLGCTYDIQSNDSYLIINLTGLEENLVNALTLLNTLVQSPKLDQKKLAILYTGEKASRKLERSEPDMIADALMEYVLYGEKSSYIDRLSLKDIKKLQADSLVAAFRLALQYAPEIHYAGRRSVDELGMLFGTIFVMAENYKASTAPYYRQPAVYLRNEVYLTPKKKAAQSKVFFHATLNEFDPAQNAVYTAFNTYFGGDFSGIVLQEIREYRSMAYSAGASIVQPPLKAQRMVLRGFVGTQADKTTEAVDIFAGLVRQMPQKPDRIQMIKRYITAAAATQRPDFRRLSQAYVSWRLKGYDQDPAATMVERITDLTPNDIFDYQKINLAITPLTIMIVGDAKRFDKKSLEKHGKVIVIKEKMLFSK